MAQNMVYKVCPKFSYQRIKLNYNCLWFSDRNFVQYWLNLMDTRKQSC